MGWYGLDASGSGLGPMERCDLTTGGLSSSAQLHTVSLVRLVADSKSQKDEHVVHTTFISHSLRCKEFLQIRS
jgi:hypothetical protein